MQHLADSDLYSIEEMQQLNTQLDEQQGLRYEVMPTMYYPPPDVSMMQSVHRGDRSSDFSNAFEPTPLQEVGFYEYNPPDVSGSGVGIEESAVFLQQLFQASEAQNDMERSNSSHSQNMILSQVAPVSRFGKRKFDMTDESFEEHVSF